MSKKKWLPWLYASPGLSLVLLVVVFPIVYTAYISLTNMNLYHWFDFEIIGLGNYVRALFKLDSGFLAALGTTILWTAVNMALQLTLAFFLALGLNAKGLRLARLYKTLLMFPWAMPAYISIILWRVGMFNTEFGLLNQLLAHLGVEKVNFLSTNVPAFLSCLALNLWMALPFMITNIDGALQSIDASWYESATLEGAGFWRKHLSITLPALRPIVTPAALMTTFTTFKQFDIIYLLTMQKGSLTGATLQTVITYTYQNAFVSNNYGLSAAVSMLIFGIIILLSMATNRTLQEGRDA